MANELQDPNIYDREAEGQQGYPNPDLGPGHDQPSPKTYDPRQDGAAYNPSDPRGEGQDSPTSQSGWDDEGADNPAAQPDYGDEGTGDGGEGTDGLDRSGLRNAEQAGAADGGTGASEPPGDSTAAGSDDPGQVTPDELRDSEETGEAGFASGFDSKNPQQQRSRSRRARDFVWRNRRRISFGSFVLGGAGGLIAAISLLVPLKIEHIVQNLESRFTPSVSGALDAASEILLKDYFSKYVIPNYKNCGTTINTACKVRIVGGNSNPVTNLYRSWAKTHFENKLADLRNPIELHFDKISQTWLLKGPGTAPDGDNIGAHGERIDKVFGRKAFQSAVVATIKEQTRWPKVYTRFILGSYMARIDGVNRCIFFCGIRSAIHETVEDLRQSAKYWVANNILQPISPLRALAIKCLLDPSCQPTQTQAQGENPPVSDFEKEEATTIESLAAEAKLTSPGDLAKLKTVYADMSERGLQRYATDQVFQLVFSKTASQKITDTLPVLGWINLAAEIVNNANDAGPKIKKLAYVIGAAVAVKYFMASQSYVDEIHTGQANSAEVGAWNSMYGPGTNSTTDPLVGGTASAEQAPLYSDLVNNTPATGVSPSYSCGGTEKPVPNQACSIEQLGGGISIFNSVHSFLNQPGFKVITNIAHGWANTIGQIFNLANAATSGVLSVAAKPIELAVENLCYKVSIPLAPDFYAISSVLPVVGPALCQVKDAAEAAAPKIADGLVNYLFPNGWDGNMGGGRAWTMTAQGAAVYGSTACDQIGCEDTNDSTASAILQQQQDEAREEFESQPLMARLFGTDSSYSLVSQLAMALPTSSVSTSLETSFAGLLNDPFGALSHTFGTILPFGHAAAAAQTFKLNADPFQIGNKAFPINDIPPDLGNYWDSHNCGDTSDNGPIAKWQQASANGPLNPKTGMPMHDKVEPCLLIQTAVASIGGADDSSLIPIEDLSDVIGTPSPASIPTTSAGATVDMAHLYDDSTSVACAPGTNDDGTADGYHDGTKTEIRLCEIPNFPSSATENKNGHAVMNSRVSGAVLAMVTAAKNAGVNLSAVSTFRTMSEQQQLWQQFGMNPVRVAKPGYSNHQMGLAIDFEGVGSSASPGSGPIWDWLDKHAGDFSYKNYPAEAWHWSPTGN